MSKNTETTKKNIVIRIYNTILEMVWYYKIEIACLCLIYFDFTKISLAIFICYFMFIKYFNDTLLVEFHNLKSVLSEWAFSIMNKELKKESKQFKKEKEKEKN